jgi:hypothetical protein
VAGTQGPQGIQGPQGAQGSPGAQGINVSGAQGAQGAAGVQGVQGQSGAASVAITQVNSLGVNTAASGVQGEIRATGTITSFYSDIRLKTILNNINNALEKLDKLHGVYYEQNDLAKQFGYNYDNERQIGVIAQEIKSVLPEAVKIAPFDADEYGESISGEDYLTVLYSRVVPLLVEALKEQKEQIDYIKSKL